MELDDVVVLSIAAGVDVVAGVAESSPTGRDGGCAVDLAVRAGAPP